MFGIITPTYNRPEYLRRLHLSIKENAGSVIWRHYVVDDGSGVSYEQVLKDCRKNSDNLWYKRIDNSGPLVARNVALDAACRDGCEFLCFLDDDDEMLPPGLTAIFRQLEIYPDLDWLVFQSRKPNLAIEARFQRPTEVNWFRDAILQRNLESDSLCVISAPFIGETRFSTRIRNQREWTFFLDLHKKSPRIMAFPDVIRGINYLEGGLTSQSKMGSYRFDQITNSIERAYQYWKIQPTNFRLIKNLLRQVFSAPIKAALGFIEAKRLTGDTKGS
jgi:glycosyltransferase involved in cell wall biosynthesis